MEPQQPTPSPSGTNPLVPDEPVNQPGFSLPHQPGAVFTPSTPSPSASETSSQGLPDTSVPIPVPVEDHNQVASAVQSASPRKKWVVITLVLIIISVAGTVAALKLGRSNKTTNSSNPTGTSTPSASSQNTQTKTTSSATATGYEDIVNQFITAIQNKDKKTADSLESLAFQASTKKDSDTTSFYDACQQAGEFCTASFSSQYLAKATKVTQDYTAANGTKGKKIIYTINQSSGNGQGVSSNSTTEITLAAIPSGSSWLIDFFDETGSTGASGALSQ